MVRTTWRWGLIWECWALGVLALLIQVQEVKPSSLLEPQLPVEIRDHTPWLVGQSAEVADGAGAAITSCQPCLWLSGFIVLFSRSYSFYNDLLNIIYERDSALSFGVMPVNKTQRILAIEE